MTSAPRPWPLRFDRLVAAAFWLAVLTLLAASPLAAQSQTTEDGAVNTGRSLELGRKWVDALTHYESSLKRWPDIKALKHGLRRTRIQCTILRRYTDRSYQQSLLPLRQTDALALFDQTLGRIQAAFVEKVSLTSFIAHGTESVYLSLANQRFLDRHLSGQSPTTSTALRDLRRELFRRYWNRPIRSSAEAHRVVAEVCQLANTRLGLPPSAIVLEYIFGGCNSLDDYSACLTPDRYNDLNANIDGQFVGLGVELKGDTNNGLLLINVLPDSPAEVSGLLPGDHIVRIDRTDCRKMTTDEAAGLLKGPVGSRVKLGILRANAPKEQSIPVVRRPVVIRSIPLVEMLDTRRGIGYIQMTGFQRNTVAELDQALARLQRQGLKAVIWDLRHNPGGLLDAATDVLDRFVADGVLVSTRGRTWDQNRVYRAHRAGTTHIPLVVLTDGESASASEIVAGAIRDHKRGLVIGRRTFGKWSVQSIFPLAASSGLRLTTARFYSPAGHNLSKVGVRPDITVTAPVSQDGIYRRPTRKTLADDGDVRKALAELRARLSG
ncbi:MAG: S41 family peptidase [Planctomycetaceae bacterium]|nr:S41 family peptidase [Planctomycetaceae bacterium]